jgi:hypothetical protein
LRALELEERIVQDRYKDKKMIARQGWSRAF